MVADRGHYARPDLTTLDDFERMPADAWLIIYRPDLLLFRMPTHQAFISAIEPLRSWPGLTSTESVWSESRGAGTADPRHERMLSDVSIVEVGKLVDAMRGEPLAVSAIRADSVASPTAGPEKVFDRDRSADGVQTWVSASSPMPHYLEIRFDRPAILDEARVVTPPALSPVPFTWRASSLEIQIVNEHEGRETVWEATGLDNHTVIRAHWPPVRAIGLRLVLRDQGLPWQRTAQASIEEVILPGYRLVPSKREPPRALTPIGAPTELTTAALSDRYLHDDARLTAVPNPVPAGPAFGLTTIIWDTRSDSTGQMWLSINDGPETLLGQAANGHFGVPWIVGGSKYDFRLYAGQERTVVLGAVTVTRSR